ncbi:MAG: hypothetical protein ACYC8T_28320 [Myxococcaceae bacterium]
MNTPAIPFLVVLALMSAGSAEAGTRVALAGVTLEPPAGWKASRNADGSATLADPGGQIVWRFFATEPASDLGAWFDEAWGALAGAHAKVNAGPPLDTETQSGLAERAGGAVMFEAQGARHILILAAISDGQRVVPTLVEFANEAAFARAPEINPPSDTIELVAGSPGPRSPFARGGWRYPIGAAGSAAATAAPVAAAPAAASANSGKLPFLGKWAVGQSASNASHSLSYGSRVYQYDFAADGTYRFHSEAWGGSFNANWRYIIDEKGNWSVNGDQLTVSPTAVTGAVRDLAGKVQKNGGPSLETATYRFQTTYFSGLQETQLVLTPARPTTRDGAFSTNSSFPRSYLLRSNYNPAFRFAP